ncbi:BlaR1 family beta-lactam sensor/signal transducer [Salipaludibacillus agaradhaerens]|uniref:BlaR1 family beta-lactam sensor/signal transducer n=1 Tax=Salipaludibacillus agaradhaerens TaxID=76935 RepID=UPI0021509EFE|nr:BlaR1 family beta-lactam sensor/signal transducer [Salipaludibacillus agaradhaerens]MCR6105682.1 BlaR1 family beta-lactam sensor/signal transducer [Salipaludibacillus agaradhaerens]MCR6117719.1 BlaR1 family beta-lactam sensor/signal transducer [Salipaludibacillus agaradhaerens]UJW56893.1 BlaR1 family beta-lactam sensor/signal transducer [Bacillus sp. A116_S68]
MTLHHIFMSIGLSSMTVLAIFLVRKIGHKHLSEKWRYHLWFLLIVVLTLPFIPLNVTSLIHESFQFEQTSTPFISTQPTANEELTNGNWMNDFSMAVSRFDDTLIHVGLIFIWIIGMVGFAVSTLATTIKLSRIIRAAKAIERESVTKILKECMDELELLKKPIVLESPSIQTPMTFGLFKTYLLLPKGIDTYLSHDELKYVFLHELYHYKSHHIKVNYVFMLYQIIYWFHPFVWKAFKEMRLDREMACDVAVLRMLDQSEYKKYGQTLIKFAERDSLPAFSFSTNQLYGTSKHLKRRIIHIAAFNKKSRGQTLKSITIFILVGLFVMAQAPILTAAVVSNDHYNFYHTNTDLKDWSSHFGSYEGSFVLYSKRHDDFQIYDLEKSRLRVSPNSTYKPYSALMALESGVITTDETALEWQGETYHYEAWNQNHHLQSAMENSVTWYFQDLDRQLQTDTIQRYLNDLNYGNKDISGGIEAFWLESSLSISAIEQVELLRDFYTNTFNFNENNVEFVKEVLKLEENANGSLFGKTGTGIVNGQAINGWFIGFLETEDDTYFFAANIHNSDNSTGSEAAEITLSILKSEGLY